MLADQMETEGKWIKFCLVDKKPKTSVFQVMTKDKEEFLGFIKWYPRWRQYAFFPAYETVFEPICLSSITDFIKKLMAERK